MMEPASDNESINSSNMSGPPKMKAIVEQKSQLLGELEKAKKENVWGNKEAEEFVEHLIKLGSLDAAKYESNGKVPAPRPTELRARGITDTGRPGDVKLDLSGFIRYAAKCSRENSDTSRFEILVRITKTTTYEIEKHDEQYIETEVEKLEQQKFTLDSAHLTWKRSNAKKRTTEFDFETEKIEQSTVDQFFGRYVEDAAKLESFLPRLLPIKYEEEEKSGIKIIQPNTEYVVSHPAKPSDFFSASRQPDKKFAIVVAGESGSGKSVFACQQSVDSGFLPLYLVLSSDDLGRQPKPDLRGFEALNGLFQSAIEMAGNDDDVDSLYALKSKVNISRDAWAQKLLEQLIDEVRNKGDPAFEKWLAGRWHRENRPEKVAIIVDEATDVDLVEGLISKVREITSLYSNLAREKVQLVLAGVGLDAIKEKGRIGTNPAYSELVVMKGPKHERMKEVGEISDEVSRALDRGVFARVLKTNTRMFFRSVLPILKLSFHSEDPLNMEPVQKKARFSKRLEEIASFRPLMDHAPRYYVNQNTVKTLGPEERDSLLLQSFAYHLVESMEGVDQRNEIGEVLRKKLRNELEIVKGFEDYRKLSSCPTKNIFAKGLASRSGTSDALKYLACFGLTCQLRTTFGDEFEELTALHFMRYMEAQGYQPLRLTLKHAWPPKRSNGGVRSCTDELREKLEEQKAAEMQNLKDQLSVEKKGKWCFVFSQGTASAQGGDVLALLLDIDSKKCDLETIQCKHYKNKPSSDNTCRGWWNSLGVEAPKSGSPNLRPSGDSSAAYSYQGLNSFRGLLEEWLTSCELQVSVRLGKRTLAMSFQTPAHFPVPDVDDCRVWFREMFDPTISVLPRKEAVTYDDTDKHQM